jgi:hypothetical protein
LRHLIDRTTFEIIAQKEVKTKYYWDSLFDTPLSSLQQQTWVPLCEMGSFFAENEGATQTQNSYQNWL